MIEAMGLLGVALAGRAFVRGSEPLVASRPCGLQSLTSTRRWRCALRLHPGGRLPPSPAARCLAPPLCCRTGLTPCPSGWLPLRSCVPY